MRRMAGLWAALLLVLAIGKFITSRRGATDSAQHG